MRVGITGYGLAGRYFHAPLLESAGFEIVGAVTNNADRIAHLASDYPDAIAYSTVEELLDQNLDLLVVASANVRHALDAIAALKSSVPVVVDKPMGRDLAETQEIVRVSEECGVPVTTFFNRLFDSDTLTIKQILKEGTLGEIFRIDSRFERFRPEPSPTAWRERSSAQDGGGNLLDLQPHLVSIVLELFGPADVVFASVRAIRGHADDDVVIVLKHKSGVDSYLSASAIVGAPGPRIRLLGSKGALVVSDLDGQESMLRAGKKPVSGIWKEDSRSNIRLHQGDEVVSYPAIAGNYGLFYLEVKATLEGKGEWPVSTNQALAVAKIIDEARKMSIR